MSKIYLVQMNHEQLGNIEQWAFTDLALATECEQYLNSLERYADIKYSSGFDTLVLDTNYKPE